MWQILYKRNRPIREIQNYGVTCIRVRQFNWSAVTEHTFLTNLKQHHFARKIGEEIEIQRSYIINSRFRIRPGYSVKFLNQDRTGKFVWSWRTTQVNGRRDFASFGPALAVAEFTSESLPHEININLTWRTNNGWLLLYVIVVIELYQSSSWEISCDQSKGLKLTELFCTGYDLQIVRKYISAVNYLTFPFIRLE